MNNFYINKRNFFWLKFLAVVIILFVFVLILNLFNGSVRNTFFSFVSPLQKSFGSAGEASFGFLSSLLNGGNFAKENGNLKIENLKLLAQISSLESIIGGNQAQSVISSTCQNEQFNLKMAGVVGMGKDDILTINKGSADGILESMPVITEQKALVGKISKVYKNYSEVQLISNKSSVINVKILADSIFVDSALSTDEVALKEIDGVIKGIGGFKVFLDLVPIDDTIKNGDTLVTSALEGVFPKDLLVGKITAVNKNDQNPHQQAQVQPFFNFSSDNLFVITNYKQN